MAFYGAAGRSPPAGPVKARLSLWARVAAWGLSFVVPIAVFAGIYRAFACPLRNTSPVVCWSLLVIGFVLIALLGFSAGLVVMRRISAHPNRPPSWFLFLFVTSAAALIAGWQLGERNFQSYFETYYEITNLSLYSAIDPAKTMGKQLMDVGQVVFTPGSKLDLTLWANVTQGNNNFCVAPITSSATPLAQYDFWAVGINCCSKATGFQCPDYNNTLAHAGVRLMDKENLPSFKLAVNFAGANYSITVGHPVFLTWTEDPIAAVNGLRGGSLPCYLKELFIFGAVQ